MPLSEKPYIPPYAEPVSLDEMKLHLRVDIDDDDTLITSIILAAREQVETVTQRQLVAATWKLYLDEFPCTSSVDVFGGVIRLGHSPVMLVDSIQYVDTNGVTQTLATSVYTVDVNTEPARIVLAYNQVWPATRAQLNAVTITYISGHATPFTRSDNDLIMKGGQYAVGERVRLTNSGGALPGGLAVNTDYLIVTAAAITRVTDDDGSAIALSSAGTGTHFVNSVPEQARQAMKIIAGDMYEVREASASAVKPGTWLTVERLLWPLRVMEMA